MELCKAVKGVMDFDRWWQEECETFYQDKLELKHYKTLKGVCRSAYLKGIADEMGRGKR